MKQKKLLLIATFICLTGAAIAQFGVHAGGTFSSATFKENGSNGEKESLDMAINPTGGIFYRMALGSEGKFAIQPELNYLIKGGQEKEEGGGETYKSKMQLNYVELPVYFLFNNPQSSGFYGGIGPAFNFGLSGKVKVDFDDISASEKIKFGKEEAMKGFHMAINAMAGYQFEGGFNVNAFVSQSVTNSANKFDGESEGKISFLNFGLRLGYTFGGGKQK